MRAFLGRARPGAESPPGEDVQGYLWRRPSKGEVITQSAKILAQISNFAKIEKCAQKIWRKKANLFGSKNVKMVNVKEAVSHFCSGSNNKRLWRKCPLSTSVVL